MNSPSNVVAANPWWLVRLCAMVFALVGLWSGLRAAAVNPVEQASAATSRFLSRDTQVRLGSAGEKIPRLDLEKRQSLKPGNRWENGLGMKFVPVPGTRVRFCVWETRVRDYQAFVDATGQAWKKAEFEQGPTHPAVNVSWVDAQAFCQWLTQKERTEGRIGPEQVYRLPTDLEWSAAVGLTDEKGTTPSDREPKRQAGYPWGTQWPPPKNAGNYDDFSGGKIGGFADGFRNTSPAGSYTPNPFGIFDLGGNVWEWCEDWYDDQEEDRGFRGASWLNAFRGTLRSSFRGHAEPATRGGHIGFRCVLGGMTTPSAGNGIRGSTPSRPPGTMGHYARE